MTEAEIAERSGWSEQRVHRLLHDKTRLLANDIEEFARILRKPIAELYRDPRARRAA
jgi:transcriptional regulator with XRE-family HTH domain